MPKATLRMVRHILIKDILRVIKIKMETKEYLED